MNIRAAGRYETREAVAALVKEYPPSQRETQLRDVERIAFNLDLSLAGKPAGARVADVGGGLGLFSLGAAALGMKVTLVDDFRDAGNTEIKDDILAVHRCRGVEVIEKDVARHGVDLASDSFDVITTFDSIEHWHHSPKPALHQMLGALKPGGTLVIGVPNCVNLRKRVTVPLGLGKWSAMSEWYDSDIFRGHVREPDADDLRYIARDLRLDSPRILGRNWLGYANRGRRLSALMPVVDRLLRPFPTLCANLYLIGTKRRQG